MKRPADIWLGPGGVEGHEIEELLFHLCDAAMDDLVQAFVKMLLYLFHRAVCPVVSSHPPRRLRMREVAGGVLPTSL